MTTIMLDTPVVIQPAQEVKTSNSFTVSYIEENYAYGDDIIRDRARGKTGAVVASVILSTEPWVERNITVWEGDDYLAVRGTWTDQDLYSRLKTLL